MKWNVERTLPSTRPGPARPLPPIVEVVEADELTIDAGTLTFTTGGVVTRAYGNGSWLTANVQESAE